MNKLSVTLLLTAANAAVPGDTMCTITGWFAELEPACIPEDNGLGQRVNLIESTARKTNSPGFSLTANYWIWKQPTAEQKKNGRKITDTLNVQLTLLSPKHAEGNAIEMWFALRDRSAANAEAYDIGACSTLYYS